MDMHELRKPNPAMEASIDKKATAAIERGADTTDLVGMGLTEDEIKYLGVRQIEHMAHVVIGETIMKTLHANNVRISQPDIIPALTAYFEAVEAGEIEAV